MVLQPVDVDTAYANLQKEWGKTSIVSHLASPFSRYARAVNQWILSLTEPFENDENGFLKKPKNRRIRLDLGYLFRQRRLFNHPAVAAARKIESAELPELEFRYRVVNRPLHPKIQHSAHQNPPHHFGVSKNWRQPWDNPRPNLQGSDAVNLRTFVPEFLTLNQSS